MSILTDHFLQNYVNRLLDWRKRCSRFLISAIDYTDKYDRYIDLVNKLIEEAHDFNVNLTEIDSLERVSFFLLPFMLHRGRNNFC